MVITFQGRTSAPSRPPIDPMHKYRMILVSCYSSFLLKFNKKKKT